LSSSLPLTYTTAQVHHRLGVPKPTIRNWSAEYASYLSKRAQPNDGKTRLFTHDDLVVLNTVRYLTREEGLNDNDQVRAILSSGHRVTDFPDLPGEEQAEALKSVRLVPVDRLERALEQLRFAQGEVERLGSESASIGLERDQALIALDEATRQVSGLREQHGRVRGILVGLGAASLGLLLIALGSLTGFFLLYSQLQP
jgi:DNA-binding transcriptional MerR regulator